LDCATTGHTLKSCTVRSIFVRASAYSCTKNWTYAVLFRVKTRKGLFLRKALDQSKDLSVDTRVVRILQVGLL
jgi:hypothetical protein